MQRWPFRREVLGPVLLLAPCVLEADTLTERPALSLGAAAVVVLASAVRRTAPLWSLFLASWLVLFTLWLGGSVWTLLACSVLSCLAGRRGTGLGAAHAVFAATGTAGTALVLVFGSSPELVTLLMLGFGGCVLPWWAGDWWRQRARLAQAGWERAERLEREQLFLAEQARLRERAHIARDMHDSLGHELSVMALLAGGLELAPDLPDRHRESAARLRERSTLAIERLHELIGLLRDGSAGPPGESIAELVRRFESSGTPVRFEEEAIPELSPLAERAAYRVVQEALTNAAKHAPGTAVTVRVAPSDGDDGVEVSVRSGRPGEESPPTPDGGGSGLIGLEERVRLAGGRLRARPTPEGFEVVARVPRNAPPVVERRDSVPNGTAEPLPNGTAGELLRTKARLRRGVRQAALVPALIGSALVVLLVGFQVVTSMTTSVSAEDYDRMRVGQPRAELTTMLPPHGLSEPPPVISEPAIPEGAVCEYYRAGRDLLRITETLYRLCFENGVLRSKDVLRAAGGNG